MVQIEMDTIEIHVNKSSDSGYYYLIYIIHQSMANLRVGFPFL